MPPDRRDPPARADAIATRARLVHAGLSLFAEHGTDGVSLSAITEAAEASNASAIQYHFGSKDGLLEAILDEYEERTSARAQELASGLPESPTTRQEVEAFVLPMGELLGQPDGIAYLKLVGQLLGHPRFSIVDRHRKGLASASRGLLGGLRRAEERDPQRWTSRWILVTGLLFYGLADYAAMQSVRKRDRRRPSYEAFIQELIDAITVVIER